MHCETGPAIAWPGWALWMWHGVRVTEQIVMHPETITAEQIKAETNAEVRRVMMQRYGAERFMTTVDAKHVSTDDYGSLYVFEFEGERYGIVKVCNSTPEPDGTFKDYWLWVDPDAYGGLKTARQAVASTWRTAARELVFESADEYVLVQET